MSTDEIIIVDWVHPEIKNDPVIVKKPKSLFWKLLRIFFIFLAGYFFGMVTVYFIYRK